MNNSILISSRIRLARNFADRKFVSALSLKEKEDLKELLHEKIKQNNPFMLDYIDMESLDDLHAGALAEDHIISPEFIKNKKGEALLVNHKEKIAVMVNEEDHLRIQVISDTDNLEDLFSKAKELDCYFDKISPIAFSEKLGYLTCCPTNLGTALRVSVMVHLPALTEAGQIGTISSAFSKIGITIRGLYGEGTKAYGKIYQISNSVSLGVTEEEIIGLIKKALHQLEESEGEMRKKLLARPEAEDRLFRCYGILQNARLLQSGEALELLSDLRMGVCEGLFDISTEKIDGLSVSVQPYNMMLSEGEVKGTARDRKRAEKVRRTLFSE